MLRISGLLLVIGCVERIGPSGADPSLGRAAPITLRANGVVAGGQTRLTVQGASPGESVRFFQSTGPAGNGPCPAALGGVCLDLGGAAPSVGSAVADANGVAVKRVPVPVNVPPGATITFQAAIVRLGGAITTNPVTRDAAWSNVGVAVDGDLGEWVGDELFGTTSAVGTGGVTWDADTLYVAFDHPDLATGGPEHWSVLYLGTGARGSTTGLTFNTQTPGLPFEASLAIRRKADGSFDSLEVWDEPTGAFVGTPSWLGTDGSSVAEGAVLELGIPRRLLGTNTVEVLQTWVFEGAGFESTYAGVPSDSFVDGYDPDPSTHLVLDLAAPEAPAVQNP